MSVESDNQRFLKILSAYLNFYDEGVTGETVREVMSAGVDIETAFKMTLAELSGVDVMKERDFFERYFRPSIKKLDVNDYYADEYFKTINFSEREAGDFKLTYLTYKPFRAFVRDDFVYYPDGRVLPQIGFFDSEYRYPAAMQGGREWMTLLPNEINSQVRYVQAARGKVLTYGLGLGYYVLKTALKSNVESVSVVDIDKNVISLFEDNILPRFPEYARKKVSVICADALLFGKNIKDGQFDYIYADIWHDVSDGLPLYEKLKQNEKFCPSAEYGYWIEDTMKYHM